MGFRGRFGPDFGQRLRIRYYDAIAIPDGKCSAFFSGNMYIVVNKLSIFQFGQVEKSRKKPNGAQAGICGWLGEDNDEAARC